MKAKEAKRIATQWVAERAAHLPGFYGAYLAGGINRVPDDETFPPYLDVDVHVILDRVNESGQRQDIYLYHGVLIESYYVDRAGYQSWEMVASHPLEAQSFNSPCVISDLTGSLTTIQKTVAQNFSRRKWVEERCGKIREQILNTLDDEEKLSSPPHMVKLLANIPYLIANARLKDPTNRRVYCLIKEILHADDRQDLYESILTVNGLTSVSREEAESRLQECLKAFDRAVEVFRTPFWSDHRIHHYVRPYIEDGALEMIQEGYHREAMFWIIWNHIVANVVIQTDAPEDDKRQFQEAYDRIYGDSHTWYGNRQNGWPAKSDTLLVRRVVDDVLKYADDSIASNPDVT